MAAPSVATSRLDALDRALEGRVVEGFDLAALGAHEVVMMLARFAQRLVARDPVADVDPAHEADCVERLEDAVDAREADAAFERFVHVRCRAAAVLPVEQADHRDAGGAVAIARLTEAALRVLGPRPRHVQMITVLDKLDENRYRQRS
jgi:hypothetical protein